MRLGISPFASTRGGVIEVSRTALEGGIDSLWLGDGYVAGDIFPGWAGAMESMTELAWLAGRFPSARIGIAAAVLPVRDPRELAREAHTIDHLTEGNFVLAVSAGYWDHDLVHRGIDPADRAAWFEEHLAALRAVLAGEGFDSEHVHVPAEGRLSPLPFRDGGPPIWLAGERPTMLRALRHGLPFLAGRLTPQGLAPLAREWHDRGGEFLAHRVFVEVDQPSSVELDGGRGAVSGSSGFVVDALHQFAAMGVRDLSIVPGHDDTSSRSNVEALVEKVLPELSF